MRKIHLLMPTILVASSIPMVSMVGCGKKEPEPTVEKKLVQFNTMGGSFIEAKQVEAGTVISEPEEPSKEGGYTFGGWYDDEACTEGNAHNFSLPVNENITIYAKWNGGVIKKHAYLCNRDSDGFNITNHDVEVGKQYQTTITSSNAELDDSFIETIKINGQVITDGYTFVVEGEQTSSGVLTIDADKVTGDVFIWLRLRSAKYIEWDFIENGAYTDAIRPLAPVEPSQVLEKYKEFFMENKLNWGYEFCSTQSAMYIFFSSFAALDPEVFKTFKVKIELTDVFLVDDYFAISGSLSYHLDYEGIEDGPFSIPEMKHDFEITFNSIRFKVQPDSDGIWETKTVNHIYDKDDALQILEGDNNWKIEGSMYYKNGSAISINEDYVLFDHNSIREKWDKFNGATKLFNNESYYLQNCITQNNL